MGLLVKWLVLSLVLMGAAQALKGVKVRSFGAALLGTAVLGALNLLVGWLIAWLLRVVLFVPAVLTLGLAYLLVPLCVNMALLKLVDQMAEEDIEIEGFAALFWLSAIVSLTNLALRAASGP